MKILLLGKDGQVGWELHRALLPLGEVIALGYPDIDFSAPETLRPLVRQVKPDIIANCVAYTAVDKAESEEALAMLINAESVNVLAHEAKELDALLLHYSTDYVFDGIKQEPYSESDVPRPINAYGRSKAAGDRAIQSSGCRHLILRTSWVYGLRGHNFLLTMLRLAKERTVLKIVDDQIGAPTWSRTLAETTAICLMKMLNAQNRKEDFSGIYNVSCSGGTSWFGFAAEIFRLAEMQGFSPVPALNAVNSHEYLLPARRPLQSRLDTSRLSARFDVSLPCWSLALQLCIDDMTETSGFLHVPSVL